MMPDDAIAAWLAGLDTRHLADLTTSEVARALRALSSCYVERRAKLAEGAALATAGKRAAFALFYGPLHFFVVRAIVGAIDAARAPVTRVIDLGCGTGAAGIAWAIDAGARSIQGLDRNGWAVVEANLAYRHFRLDGRASQKDITRVPLTADAASAVLAAYTANELTPDGRATLLASLLQAHARGARVLVVEPISRRAAPWWGEWERAFADAGGRADEWRFPSALPPTQRTLARAAGLDPRELTARSLWLGASRSASVPGIESPDARSTPAPVGGSVANDPA